MAQNFDIPFAFEFMPAHKTWHVLSFRIVGTERDYKAEPAKFLGTDTHIPLVASPSLQQSNKPVIQFSSDVDIPSLSSERLYTASGPEESGFINALAKLALRGKAIPAELTQLLVSDDSQPSPSKRRADAWTMRDELFKLDDSPPALVRFLNKWGEWGGQPTSFHSVYRGTDILQLLIGKHQPRFLLPAMVWRQQEEFRTALLGTPAAWLSSKARLGVTHQRSNFPYLGITARTCTQAIETTITLDHLRKVKSRICARPDCDTVFTVDSDHGRIYCTQYCGHLVSVRRNRAAAKRTANTTKRKRA